MAKRLQVFLEDAEHREIQRAAQSRRMSLAEWVRQALGIRQKLAAVRRAVRYQFPTGDIDQMLAEIESARRLPNPSP